MTFADLMPVMVILARYGYGDGHMELFQAAYGWLEEWYGANIYFIKFCQFKSPAVVRGMTHEILMT